MRDDEFMANEDNDLMDFRARNADYEYEDEEMYGDYDDDEISDEEMEMRGGDMI